MNYQLWDNVTRGQQGPIGPTGPSGSGTPGPTGPTGPIGSTPTNTYGSAYSTALQTLTHLPPTAANIRHDVVSVSNGIIITTGTPSYFTVPTSGVYKFVFSVQLLGDGNGGITIWIKVNGSSVPETGTLTLFKNNQESVLTTEYLLNLNANDQVEVWGISQSADCIINYVIPGGTPPNDYPACPGIITNMYKLSQP